MGSNTSAKADHVCAACGDATIQVSRKKNALVVRLLQRLLPIKFYRCEDCDERYWRFKA